MVVKPVFKTTFYPSRGYVVTLRKKGPFDVVKDLVDMRNKDGVCETVTVHETLIDANKCGFEDLAYSLHKYDKKDFREVYQWAWNRAIHPDDEALDVPFSVKFDEYADVFDLTQSKYQFSVEVLPCRVRPTKLRLSRTVARYNSGEKDFDEIPILELSDERRFDVYEHGLESWSLYPSSKELFEKSRDKSMVIAKLWPIGGADPLSKSLLVQIPRAVIRRTIRHDTDVNLGPVQYPFSKIYTTRDRINNYRTRDHMIRKPAIKRVQRSDELQLYSVGYKKFDNGVWSEWNKWPERLSRKRVIKQSAAWLRGIVLSLILRDIDFEKDWRLSDDGLPLFHIRESATGVERIVQVHFERAIRIDFLDAQDSNYENRSCSWLEGDRALENMFKKRKELEWEEEDRLWSPRKNPRMRRRFIDRNPEE
ncbi:hypothetical protein BJ508DRAFT_410389 [Ascobolus immersus RN42]|uniref:Uncharacterized protein n=1 Tax=Ascobolus immersus RN42 TaxID=1160509 RepID=A0A3N4INY7_ASCIM|nr:hypothetical protein BJ508DRAFT_410389 [Ascobolus immersus RN42]